jgi:hypothetical protein
VNIPLIWKFASIIPIIKNGWPSDPANYRPISLTCNALKTLGSWHEQLCIVFQAIVVSRIQYAISAWGVFVHADWKRKIDNFFMACVSVGSVLRPHCLHFIVPAIKSSQYDLRDRGHDLQLPDYQCFFTKSRFSLIIYFKQFELS